MLSKPERRSHSKRSKLPFRPLTTMSAGQGALQLWAPFSVMEWKFNSEEVVREQGHLLWQRQPVSEGGVHPSVAG